MDIAEIKKEIRKEFKNLRGLFMPEQIEESNRLIFTHFKNWFKNKFEQRQPRVVHLYLSMAEKREVDTIEIRNWLEGAYPEIKIVVPVVDPLTDTLKQVWVSPEVEMVKTRFGVSEPKMQTKVIAASETGLVIVPMLGFDNHGIRIGYGKGFYDKFLATLRSDCVCVGLCFEACRYPGSLPAEHHDLPLRQIITETGVHSF